MDRRRLHLVWRRARLPLACSAFTAAGLAAVLLTFGREHGTPVPASLEPAAAAPGSACPPAPRGVTPAVAARVGLMFVRSAVLRQNPGCSFDLATAKVRGKASREAWAAGRLPFQAFTYRDPDRLRARIVPRVTLARVFGSWFVLDDGLGNEQVFELVLVLRGGRWLVDFWGPVAGLGSDAA